jgi:hypothetical protein
VPVGRVVGVRFRLPSHSVRHKEGLSPKPAIARLLLAVSSCYSCNQSFRLSECMIEVNNERLKRAFVQKRGLHKNGRGFIEFLCKVAWWRARVPRTPSKNRSTP